MSGSAKAGTIAERHTCELRDSEASGARSQERALGAPRFSLTKDLHGCRSVRLRSRFLLNSFWRQLLTHYKARTEALYESIEKSPIDVHGSKTRGTFVAQSVGAGA